MPGEGGGRMTDMLSLRSNALRSTLKTAGGSLKSLTVLAPQNDPFRVDTDANHRDGAWLANTIEGIGVSGRRHLRGLHYILIGQHKPNGQPYTNTDTDWLWLGSAAKAARWLGYLQFDQIVDQRNAVPEIREFAPPNPQPWVSVDFEVTVPDYDDLQPYVGITGFTGMQPYRLVLVGEKHSLKEVLDGIATDHQADLYLPTGEMSDTMAHTLAASADQDGRPLVVLCFSDCDPSGWQMPISLSRKLQALKALLYPNLEFEVHRVGLTPDQVREYGLPSTPLKDTEKRADRWQAAMLVAQTEIDALAALQPDLLRQIASDAIAPFYDHTLAGRVSDAKFDWVAEAQTILDQQTGDDIAQLRIAAAERLAEKREEIKEILDTVRVDGDRFDFPTPEIPEAILNPRQQKPTPLCDSRWNFTEQCARLKASKDYTVETASGGAE
jgi:hypothetical protein